MAALDIRNVLSYDGLSSYLGEFGLDDDLTVDLSPESTLASVDTIYPRNEPIRFKKPRRYVKADIISTRRQAARLQMRLGDLKSKRKVRKMLTKAQSRCGLDWKSIAFREWILKSTSSEMNSRLRQHVTSIKQLIDHVSQLIHQQMKTVPKSVRIDCRIVEIKNRAHVYRTMRGCLDIRTKGLDAIVDHCNDIPVGSTSELRDVDWNVFALESRGVGVEFYEYVALPFSSCFISDAFNRWPTIKLLDMSNSQSCTCDFDSCQHKSSPLNKRMILRRIVNVNNCTIMLWEDALCLQSNSMTSSVLVRGSGWAMIAPLMQAENGLSVVHSGGLIQIQASEGTSITPADLLTKDIVDYTQAMQRSRITSLETILINMV